jgi:hypothetical protein
MPGPVSESEREREMVGRCKETPTSNQSGKWETRKRGSKSGHITNAGWKISVVAVTTLRLGLPDSIGPTI